MLRQIYKHLIIGGILVLSLSGCHNYPESLFELLKSERTGVLFNNLIQETDSFNILFDEYIYNGGGVGIGDFNNDGFQDLYFTGNNVPNKLYLNRGNFKFEDVTEKAHVGAEDIWSSGISVVDINNDGWLDMYVSATFKHENGTRKNKLFINKGLTDGIPVFIDKASEYGIDDDGHSTQAVFFDYDLDGDLDLYILNNVFLGRRVMSNETTNFQDKSLTIDELYRNEGKGKFKNVSNEAGITLEGFGLGIAVLDINKDGYPDLYVSNDFISSDVLYVNNRDGTFSNQIDKYFKHISFASMGNDVSDINDDGLIDVMTLEMLPSDIRNMKMMYSTTVFNRDKLIMNAGYYKQFLRNCLQYNNGNGTFSDISYLLGISSTDWSWSTLFADFDNDGYRDLAIANGFPKNVTDKDYNDKLMQTIGLVSDSKLLLPYIPEYKSKNFFFKNHEGHSFEDVSDRWGIHEESYSNGAAFADLDNDGDLDYVTNNINQPAYIFKNNLNILHPGNNWIEIKLHGSSENKNGFGAKISLYTHGKLQYYEHNPYRGYISSVDPDIHFGLDTCSFADSLRIIWPAGETQILYKLPSGDKIVIDFRNASKSKVSINNKPKPIFRDITDSLGLIYKHKELEFMDFQIQPLLPHLYSRQGPGLAVGDLNGDGLEDVVVGNGRGADITFLIQRTDGGFDEKMLKDTADVEVTGLLLFDADNDGDPDLYAVSGGSEFHSHSYHFRDRLFKNTGNGEFVKDQDALPDIFISGSIVTACDYDRDGDLDLFIGGRVIPQSYPMAERSILLRNDGGIFRDITGSACKQFMHLGMVSTALWTDYDMDGWVDLMIAGEWMPIRMFKNEKGTFREVSSEIGLTGTEGWWNSLNAGDFDNDGDLDYVLGNQGLNNRYKASRDKPVYVVATDFDNNGIIDPVINAWIDGNYYPVHLRNDLIRQMPFMKKRFPTYIAYSSVRSDELFSKEELKNAVEYKARMFESVLLMHSADGTFSIQKLPFEAQFAPVKAILVSDFDFDDNADIIMIGNNFDTESLNGSHDAFIGLFLKGNGEGNFSPVPVTRSGFFIDGDGRSLISLFNRNNDQLMVASQNNDSLKVFDLQRPSDHWIRFSTEKSDRLARVYHRDGSVKVREFYYGSSYISQSSRDFIIDKTRVEKIVLVDYDNKPREISIAYP